MACQRLARLFARELALEPVVNSAFVVEHPKGLLCIGAVNHLPPTGDNDAQDVMGLDAIDVQHMHERPGIDRRELRKLFSVGACEGSVVTMHVTCLKSSDESWPLRKQLAAATR